MPLILSRKRNIFAWSISSFKEEWQGPIDFPLGYFLFIKIAEGKYCAGEILLPFVRVLDKGTDGASRQKNASAPQAVEKLPGGAKVLERIETTSGLSGAGEYVFLPNHKCLYDHHNRN